MRTQVFNTMTRLVLITLLFFLNEAELLAKDSTIHQLDPYADAVVDYRIYGTQNTHTNPNTVLANPCKGANQDLSLGGGWVIVDMGFKEEIIDSTGADLRVYESEDNPYCNGGAASPYEVFVSNSPNGPWISIGNGNGVSTFDISSSGLASVRYVRVEDRSTGQPDNSSPTPGADIAGFEALHMREPCAVPFFSQRDGAWENHPLRTRNNACSAYCSTIGHCGCTLTSAAMVFNSYGANTNPPQLSDCMDTLACPFSWNTSISCSNGKVNRVSRLGFSWDRLDQELNLNYQPVILGMCKKGTCHLDYDNDPNTHAQTHWVVVLSGQGTDPEYYLIHDPWYKCGANIPLATRSEDWQFTWMSVYEGTIPCSSLTAVTPPCVNRGANPQPVQFGSNPNNTYSQLNVSPSSVISGTVWIYTRTTLTMTVEVTATSSMGNVMEMLIWTDTVSNTTWQSFTPFVWLPASEFVYARFRDDLGNVTDVYSDTINPVGPPNAPFEIFLPLVKR